MGSLVLLAKKKEGRGRGEGTIRLSDYFMFRLFVLFMWREDYARSVEQSQRKKNCGIERIRVAGWTFEKEEEHCAKEKLILII